MANARFHRKRHDKQPKQIPRRLKIKSSLEQSIISFAMLT